MKFHVTYQIVTQESAEQGEAAESGFIDKDLGLRVGEPWLRQEAKHLYGSEATLVSLDDDRCHMRANTNARYGYLYVAAWIDGEPT